MYRSFIAVNSFNTVQIFVHSRPRCVAAFTFCQQVSPEQYEDQREAATLENLRKLLCDISSSQTLSVKERRRLLKDFEKHHPVVFLQHLSSTF